MSRPFHWPEQADVNDEDLHSLILLMALPGVGDARLRVLLAEHGSPRAALRGGALSAEAKAARSAMNLHDYAAGAVADVRGLDVQVWLETDAQYPRGFHNLYDPPPVVFARGNTALVDRTSVAIVGTRRATTYGIDAANILARGLARAGVVVVSGLARGIDGAAHRATLDAGGATIGVLGTGIDVSYPHDHAELQAQIAREGLLLSELPPGYAAKQFHFPKRNRLIAALSRIVVVVEAPERSGALITAEHAQDLGRDVMVVPGPIGRPTSVGSLRLLREGAAWATSADDILSELGLPPAPPDPGPTRPPPIGPSAAILRVLGEDGTHIDDVALAAGVSGAAALVGLLELELGGWVRQLPGKRFARA
jgi:DNA processing protein